MPVPHLFPTLIEGPVQAVVLCGTGLSMPDAPTVNDLKNNLDDVATSQGVPIVDDFYELASAVLTALRGNGYPNEDDAKVRLADQLGLLKDAKWFGKVGVPLSGNLPRHRVLARFAVEERLRAVISLNWDSLLEAALESAGLEHECASARPWKKTKHATVVVDQHLPQLGDPSVFPLYKPHGCVRDLRDVIERRSRGETTPPITFKLTHEEMNVLPPIQAQLDHDVQGLLAQCPLIAMGWRATEAYLKDSIVKTAIEANHQAPDSFTLISRTWYAAGTPRPPSYHDEISVGYDRDRARSFAQADSAAPPTMDCWMLWLQARYCLHKLKQAAPDAALRNAMDTLIGQIQEPDKSHPLVNVFDSWLPAWVKLCWRSGAMVAADPLTGTEITADQIPIAPIDVHIPLAGLPVIRHDLVAAARLLANVAGSMQEIDFAEYPGCIFHQKNDRIYLPMPNWRMGNPVLDVSLLQPLAALRNKSGYFRSIRIIRMNCPLPAPDARRETELKAQIQGCLSISGLMVPGAIEYIDCDAVAGDLV